jgi:hypothetical protein
MPRIYFHDLPVYRLSEEAYHAARNKFISNIVAQNFSHYPATPEAVESFTDYMKQRDYDTYGPWQFNEIIGYVSLYFLGSQIRGAYFAVTRKRVVLSRRKTLVHVTHKLAPEHDVPHGATNAEILQVILGYVDACRKEERRRFFDDTWLRTIGPFVAWNGVMRSHPET